MATLYGGGTGGVLLANTFSLHPVDILIFIAFLAITLIVGLSYGQQVKTIKDYALGGKNFLTATLIATIVATYSSGSGFFINVENTYSSGLYYILASLGLPISLWLSGRLAMRMGEFMHHVSVAEAMGSMYGRTVQIITACSSILAKVGYIAVQFKALATILEVLFQLDGTASTSIAAGIVILYSASGGVKSVAFTDVLQFLTFGAVIPILALVIWNNLQDTSQIMTTLVNNPMFNPKQAVGWHPEFMETLSLFLYFGIPQIYVPSVFQRIALANSTSQARRMLTYAAWTLLLIDLMTMWIGILLLADQPGLPKEQIIPYLVNHHTYVGLKGLLGVGVMALAVSTADSSLNALSVMFANDLVKPLTRKMHGSVMTAKAFSVAAGFFALLMALYSKDLLKLLLLSGSFYMPIFAMPMLWAVLGFRTSTKGVLLSMAAGFSTAVLWSIFVSNASSIVPGMLANLIVLLGSHYLLGEPGGWQKVAPDSPLGLERAARKEAWQRRIEAIKNFKLYPYLQKSLPQQEGIYSLFGFYAIIATYSALYAIEPADVKAYNAIYEGIVHTGLFATTALLTFPIWPPTVKSQRFITFFWPLGIAALLFFAGTLIVIMSHFHPMQVMVLVINLLVAVLFLHTPLALSLAVMGVGLALWFFMQYTGAPLPWGSLDYSQYRLLYGLLLLTGLLLALLKGKESYAQLGRKNEVLTRLDKDNQERLLQAVAERNKALKAFQGSGVEKLLTVARDLQELPVEGKVAEKLQAIEETLIPIAFQLQGIDTRALDYLRLQIKPQPIQELLSAVKQEAQQKGINQPIHCKHATQYQEIACDPAYITELLVKSMLALQRATDTLPEEETRTILIGLEDTMLHYPLPDVEKHYVKQVKALRIVLTTGASLPPVDQSYTPNLAGTAHATPENIQALEQLANNRIIKSHYGYAAVTDHTLVYVVPVDLEEVRPKDMDKAYMEVDATPQKANDHFINEKQGIDAQAQEAAFLTEVAARSKADIGKIKMALELIKWYHGPKSRNSGEPFYLHPLTVAQIVLDYNQDESTIIGALLHDTVEDTPMLLQQIEAVFGKETADVVDVVTHLQSIPGSFYKIKLSASQNLQMLKRTNNKQGLYVKLADRMHNMRTIEGHSKLAKRRLIAEETMQFFVPLAEELVLPQAAQEFEKLWGCPR